MNLDDFLDDSLKSDETLEKTVNTLKGYADHHSETELEIEESNSKYERETYINRNLIFSDRYISAIKSLNESRECSRLILNAARSMTDHHHGDKYEDLYFINSMTNEQKANTNYRRNHLEVMPTDEMKRFAKENPNDIISMHNHPLSSLPSFTDVSTCKEIGYKYGLVICHNGNIYKYDTTDKDINQIIYESEVNIYEKDEAEIIMRYNRNMISKNEVIKLHDENFIKLTSKLLDAGVILKEVLWNVDDKRTRDNKQG